MLRDLPHNIPAQNLELVQPEVHVLPVEQEQPTVADLVRQAELEAQINDDFLVRGQAVGGIALREPVAIRGMTDDAQEAYMDDLPHVRHARAIFKSRQALRSRQD